MKGTHAPPLVCVVDEDDSTCLFIRASLVSVGFDVRTFSSGPEFLLSGLANSCACLVVDVLSTGMTAFELQQVIRSAQLDLPVVFVAEHADDAMRSKASASGALALLSKPLGEPELLDSLRIALASRPGQTML
jgi:two-component system, LuxR family, response regulator FixJ